jgi:hypothetical protein
LQFKFLSRAFLKHWRNKHEKVFADYFEKEYLTPPYDMWSTTVSGVPGVTANQNPIESFHAVLKKVYLQDRKTPLCIFLAHTSESLMKDLAVHYGVKSTFSITRNPIGNKHRDMLFKATQLYSNETIRDITTRLV